MASGNKSQMYSIFSKDRSKIIVQRSNVKPLWSLNLLIMGIAESWLYYFLCRNKNNINRTNLIRLLFLVRPGRYAWLMIAFIIWNSNLVPLLEGLCSSNPCRFEFSAFGGLPASNRQPRDWQSRALTNWASFTLSRMLPVIPSRYPQNPMQ